MPRYKPTPSHPGPHPSPMVIQGRPSAWPTSVAADGGPSAPTRGGVGHRHHRIEAIVSNIPGPCHCPSTQSQVSGTMRAYSTHYSIASCASVGAVTGDLPGSTHRRLISQPWNSGRRQNLLSYSGRARSQYLPFLERYGVRAASLDSDTPLSHTIR